MKSKTKPIRIEESVYDNAKKYCDENALKISRWISKIIQEKLIEECKKEMDKKLS